MKLPIIDIKRNIQAYKDRHKANSREASFDYCYNYFYKHFIDNKLEALAENLELSCLHLGFFLASWGMYRDTWIKEQSIKVYEPLIYNVIDAPKEYWTIDVKDYSNKSTRDAILKCKKMIQESFENERTDTFITKIILGVFGSVPALDTYFNIGIFSATSRTLTSDALEFIYNFYLHYKTEIDSPNNQIKTIDYTSEDNTKIIFPKAKLIDMIGWIEGERNILEIEKKHGKGTINSRLIKDVKDYISIRSM